MGAYWNGKKLFQKPRSSYVELVDGTIIEFTAENTPFNNFIGKSGLNPGSEIIINKKNILINDIKKIYFHSNYKGENYNGSFISSYLSLTDLIINGLSNITETSDFFIYNCTSLINLDISGMINLTNMSNSHNFLLNSSSLEIIKINSIDFSDINIGHNPLQNIQNNSSCKIIASSQQFANIFKSKFGGNYDYNVGKDVSNGDFFNKIIYNMENSQSVNYPGFNQLNFNNSYFIKWGRFLNGPRIFITNIPNISGFNDYDLDGNIPTGQWWRNVAHNDGIFTLNEILNIYPQFDNSIISSNLSFIPQDFSVYINKINNSKLSSWSVVVK